MRVQNGVRVLTVALCLGSYGCATLNAPLDSGPCRDARGRFASCSSGSGDVAWGLLGISLGLALVGGIIYAASRPRAQPQPPVPDESAESAPQVLRRAPARQIECLPGVPSDIVQTCIAEAGYSFALPPNEACPPRSRGTGTMLTACDDRVVMHHACVRSDGSWRTLPGAQSCRSVGFAQADGAWVQPGQPPGAALVRGEGVTPASR